MVELDRYDISRDGKTIVDKTTNKPLKIFKSNKYLQCCIHDKNGMHVMGVHSIVAQKYSPDWFDGCNVHHKDHNPQNNNIDNLECLNPSEHTKLHNPVKYKDKKIICPRCKKEFLWTGKAQSRFYRNKSKTGPYCSKDCARKGNAGIEYVANNKRRVICIETSETYESIKQASEVLRISYSQIWQSLNDNLKTAHKLHFKYA